MSDDRLRMAAAEQVLRTQGRSFHWAKRLLSPVHAARAARLYVFCRQLDDLADEGESPARAAENLAAVAEALLRGHSSDPIVEDALDLMAECAISPEVPLALIRGLQDDLGPVRFQTQEQLIRYCYRVAGTVGLMMSDILDVKDPSAAPFAIDLGIAMQLTNIVRDVKEDAQRDRCYLPTDFVGSLPFPDLVRPGPEDEATLRHGLRRLLALAEDYYRSGESGLPYLPGRARHGILVAARVYRAIGLRLESRGFDAWGGRVIVSTPGKLFHSLVAIVGSLFQPGFWIPRRQHEARLHRPLRGLPRVHCPDERAS